MEDQSKRSGDQSDPHGCQSSAIGDRGSPELRLSRILSLRIWVALVQTFHARVSDQCAPIDHQFARFGDQCVVHGRQGGINRDRGSPELRQRTGCFSAR